MNEIYRLFISFIICTISYFNIRRLSFSLLRVTLIFFFFDEKEFDYIINNNSD